MSNVSKLRSILATAGAAASSGEKFEAVIWTPKPDERNPNPLPVPVVRISYTGLRPALRGIRKVLSLVEILSDSKKRQESLAYVKATGQGIIVSPKLFMALCADPSAVEGLAAAAVKAHNVVNGEETAAD